MITGVVGNHWDRYEDHLTLWGRLYFLVRIKEVYLAGPQYLPTLAGILLSLALSWWRPMAGVTLLCAIGGYLGLLSFPQCHDRYYLPEAALLTTLAVAPLGVVAWPGPLRRIRELAALALAAPIAAYGLHFSAAGLTRTAPSLRGYGQIADDLDLAAVYPPGATPDRRAVGNDVVRDALTAPPRHRITSAPRPDGTPFPASDVAAIIATDLATFPRTPGERQIHEIDPRIPLSGVCVELAVRGFLDITSSPPHSEPGHTEIDLSCNARPCYAVGTAEDPQLAARIDAEGFQRIGTVPLPIPGRRDTRTLVVWRR
jgi:hypothetical protein